MPQTLANPQAPTLIRDRSVYRQWDTPAPLRLWHLASLDAPTVAVIWTLGFAWAANVHLPPWVPLLLALVTWTVYIADRLLDARGSIRTGTTHRLRLRHRFHWRHRRIFIPLAVAATCAAVWIVFFLMPPAARERNSVLAAAALTYFTRVHSNRNLPPFAAPTLPSLLSQLLSKELLVAILFTAACALPSISRLSANAALLPLLTSAVFFALLAWLNCHAIEKWESIECESDPRPPAKTQILPLAIVLGLIGSLLAASLFAFQPRAAALLAAGAASTLLLALLDRLRSRLTPLALRTTADLVLLTPLLFLLVELHYP